MVFLFVGEDEFAKDAKLAIIKRDVLGKDNDNFNLDILHARELDLVNLQEAMARLPIKARRRIIVIRDCGKLKDQPKEFLVAYAKKPYKHLILILDIRHFARDDKFLNKISTDTKIFRFKESELTNTFKLADEINRKRASVSLDILHRLLIQGEKPERIMGGLRYAWGRGAGSYPEASRRLSLLLNCDIEIKTGRLNAEFALEKLLVSLCCF